MERRPGRETVIPREAPLDPFPRNILQAPTEESTLRFLVSCRNTRNRPRPAAAPPNVSCGLPRLSSHEPTADSSAPRPSGWALGSAWPGLGMTASASLREVPVTGTNGPAASSLPGRCSSGAGRRLPAGDHGPRAKLRKERARTEPAELTEFKIFVGRVHSAPGKLSRTLVPRRDRRAGGTRMETTFLRRSPGRKTRDFRRSAHGPSLCWPPSPCDPSV
jgi:hypothetical protein